MKTLRALLLAILTGALISIVATACKDSAGQAGHGARNPNIVILSEKNFENEVMTATNLVLVDFWATWCPPCKMLAPIIDEIATEYQGRVKVASLDVDKAPALSERYQVQAIPTVLMFRGGKVADQFVGLRSKKEIKNQLDKLLAEGVNAPGPATNAATR
jgi:thioredoxin 1